MVSAMEVRIPSGLPLTRFSTGSGPRALNVVTVLVSAGEPPLHVERLPRALLLVLGDAEGVLARMSLAGVVEDAGGDAEGVDDDEAHGPADGGVGPVARPVEVDARVDAELVADRSVHNEQLAATTRARVADVEVRAVPVTPPFVRPPFERGQDDREVLRPAPGHDRVDGGQPDRHLTPVLRHPQDDLLGIATGHVQKGPHPLLGRRDDRQTVRPPLLREELHRLHVVCGGDYRLIAHRPPRPFPDDRPDSPDRH